MMSSGPVFDDAPEADVAEQLIPVDASEEDDELDFTRVRVSGEWDANEADLLEQAIAVPDDDEDFDR